jgi:hypothetical protein
VWPTLRVSVTAALIVVVSFLLVALASTLALVRAQVKTVDADLASVIRADYSADPHGATLAPLTEGIVDVARRDERRLQETIPGIEIVPVSHQPASTVAEDGAEPATAATGPVQASPTFEANAGEPTPPLAPGASPEWSPPELPLERPPDTPPAASPVETPLLTPPPTSPPTSAASPSVTLTSAPTLTPVPTLSPTETPSPRPTRMHDR